MSKSLIIVGAGHAAAEVVAMLRKNQFEGQITLVGDEPHLPYQRPPLSKKYFSDELAVEKLYLRNQGFYEQVGVTLKLGQTVTLIDRVQQQISLDNGEHLSYDHLILATGSRPRELPISGFESERVKTLRGISDVDAIKQQLTDSSRLLIIGGGFIGLEVAASARQLGCKVTVLEAMDRVLKRVTGEQVSHFYQNLHTAKGVDVRLNTVLQEFQYNESESFAILGDGEKLAFDLAIVGIGVLPNSELAAEAGLACDNGILVNEFCQTSDEKIYAIGDCCNHPSALYKRRLRLESVPNALAQAKTAVNAICGKPEVYDEVPWFWSDQYHIKLQAAGLNTGFDQAVLRGDPQSESFSVFYLLNNHLLSVDAVNSPIDFMVGRQLVAKQVELSVDTICDTSINLKTLI